MQDFTWVIPEKLAVSRRPTFNDAHILLLNEIDVIVNLTEEEHEAMDFPGYELYHIPVVDFSVPTDEQVQEFITLLDESFAENKRVLVHCTAGCGRSGTMIGIYYGHYTKQTDIDALLTDLRKKRSCFLETDAQLSFVTTYVTEKLGI